MDTVSITTRSNDPQIGKSLKLIGNRLRFHPDRLREFGDAEFVRSNQGVQETQPGVIGQYFENYGQTTGLDR